MQNQFFINDLNISFPNKSKFASKHIDAVAHEVFSVINKKNVRLKFDLTSFDWIAPESLIFITALFSHFNNNNIPFFVNFKKQRLPEDVSKKDAKRLIYIWEKWGISQLLRDTSFIVPDYSKFCDIDDKYIKGLKKQHNIDEDSGSTEMYNDWKIVTNIPFYSYQSSESYDKYDEQTFESSIDECVTLLEDDEDIDLQQLNDKLKRNPIIDKTLSSIILRELFENSIKHGYEGKSAKELYFGLGFNKAKKDSRILRLNFESEAIPETWSFFTHNNEFKNESFIEFSFIDFGNGIYSTLQEEYENFISDDNNRLDLSSEHFEHHQHSRILEYAFHFNSSRNPIYTRFKGELIPRGLYDLLSIIWRYKGVLIVRSGYGKILYNFSDEKIIHPKDAIRFFDNENFVFKGTMMTIYLPNNQSVIKKNVIRPITNIQLNTLEKNQYIDVLRLISNAKKNDGLSFYNLLFQELDNELKKRFIHTEDTILPLDFAGCNFEKEATKKILMYLVTTHNIKLSTTIIALNIEEESFIEQIQDELIRLGSIRKEFVFRPILCLFENIQEKTQNTIWIGIHNRTDEKHLNKTLSDFIKSHSQEGKSINEWLIDGYLPQLIEENMIRPKFNENKIYLTSGNYYQKEFLSFLNTFQNEQLVQRISTHLIRKLCSKQYDRIKFEIENSEGGKVALISITISSQLLAKSVKKELEHTFSNTQFELIRLSNYYSFYSERPFLNMANQSVILVCDVIATGFLLGQVQKKLESLNKVRLIGIMCVSDTRNSVEIANDNIEKVKPYYINNNIDIDCKLTLSLTNTNITKYPFKGFFEEETNKHKDFDIERINPITNGLNVRNKHEYSNNCLFAPEEFLNFLPNEKDRYLKIGFIEHNQSFHTYYFETTQFFYSQEGVNFIDHCLTKIQQKNLEQYNKELNINCVIYPIFSGAEFNVNTKYKAVFNKHSKGEIDFITAPRVSTPKGWRFTTIPENFTDREYDTIFIIDDGSCTGETILQLLDEISVFDSKSIIILSVIARVEDFQREFFSKISQIQIRPRDRKANYNNETVEVGSNDKKVSFIPVKIFFGVHFHIPVYNLSTFNYFLNDEKNLSFLKEERLFPKIAKKHIDNRLSVLERKDSNNLFAHTPPHYIPTQRTEKSIDSVEIFKWRNLLGCIQGYKFYKEYFLPFTALHKNYISQKYRSQAIRDLEVLGSIILHEPELVQIFKDLLPDIYELLKRFIESIIIGTGEVKKTKFLKSVPTNNGKEIYKFNIDKLTYKWSPFSLICLYALIHKPEFFNQEDSEENILSLIDFCKSDDSATSFLMYFICTQVPFNEKQVISKTNRPHIENFIKEFSANYDLVLGKKNSGYLEKIQRYFLSNPYLLDNPNSVTESFIAINKFYTNDLLKGKHHNLLSYTIGTLYTFFESKKENPPQNDENIKNLWKDVSYSLLLMKRYSLGLESFLRSYEDDIMFDFLLGNRENSLSYLIAEIDTIMDKDKWITDDFMKLIKYFDILDADFISISSPFRSLFAFYSCDILEIWKSVCEIKKKRFESKIYNIGKYDFKVPIHRKVLHRCFMELITNINNHAIEETVEISIENEVDKMKFTIKSQKDTNKSNEGNKGSGIDKIKELLGYYKAEINSSADEIDDSNCQDVYFYTYITFKK